MPPPLPVVIAEVVDQAVETCRPLIEARRQALSGQILAEPIHVDGDPVRLAQTLGNLLSNAAKYTPEGGAITLAAQAHADSVVLRVIDNGHGIAPELLTGVFDLLHSGTIEARSDGPGCGSEFVVTLPRYLPGTNA